VGLGLAVALGLATAAGAPEEPCGYALAHELMSPFCPGRTLAACPSPQAEELRVWILAQEAAGATCPEIQAMLYERYGDQILSAPRAEGIEGISAYAVLAVVLLGGAGLAFWVVRRLAAGSSQAASASATPPRPAPRPEDVSLANEVDREIEELEA